MYCDSETGICQTLLEQHVDQRNIDIASMLLRNGANPDCTHSGDGNTLLMSTVFGNDREMSFLLCEFGADIEATNAEGKDVKYHAKKNPGLYLELKNRFSR